jgi:hypothetical protein
MIMEREAIAEQAEQAARDWAANPGAPRPGNPHLFESDAAKAWAAAFERFSQAHTAGDDAERSA